MPDPRKAILAAATADRQATINATKRFFNCRSAAIDPAGDVWIADPQTGHWLNDTDLESLAAYL